MKIKDIKIKDIQILAEIRRRRQFDNKEEDLARAFVWRLTPEGYEFWKLVNEGVMSVNNKGVIYAKMRIQR